MESACLDKKVVSLQLSRELKNDFSTVKRCVWGYPQVIRSSLISEGSPFPTLFWLTCPFLRQLVSGLETRGLIGLFESRIKHETPFREKYLRAHAQTAALKKTLLGESELPTWQRDPIVKRGIGGIKNLESVKCLHLQLANFLGGVENPVGREVWESLETTQCDGKKVVCERLLRENE